MGSPPSMKMTIFKGDHHVWVHHPAPKWSFREEKHEMQTKEERDRVKGSVPIKLH
jgi:hypothetical protein